MSATRFVMLTALVAFGCNARYACEKDGNRSASDPLTSSAAIDDSFHAAASGDAQTWKFRATLSGLPELWPPDGAILRSALQVSISLAYESPPLGGDGRTEMPRLQLSFPNLHNTSDSFGGITSITPSFPGPQPELFEARLFDICWGQEQTDCCRFGERECTVDRSLRLERIDGQPFPPVAVRFSAQGSAQTSSCPLGDDEPSLSLVRVEP